MRSLGFGRTGDSAGATGTTSSSAPAAADSSAPAATRVRWAPAATVAAPGYAGDEAAASRHGHTATSIPGGRVLVVGGVCSHSDRGPLRDAHLLETRSMTWHRAPDYPARTGLCFHTATFVPSSTSSTMTGSEVEGQVVVLGGVGEAPRSMLSCTSLHTQAPCTWSRQEAMQEPGYPEPRQSHSAVLVDRCRIFVCGGVGQHLPSGEAFSDVWIFHLDTLLWLKAEPSGASFPGRGGHSASMMGRLMLVFGGAVGASSSSHFNDLWAFDVDHHLWVQVQTEQGVSPPVPRTGHVAIAIAIAQMAANELQQCKVDDVGTDERADPGLDDELVTVGSLLIMGGQSAAARGYLALSSKDTFHADSWHAELLLPRTMATSAALDSSNSNSRLTEDEQLLLLPSPTPAHSVGARLRLRWRDTLITDTDATHSSSGGLGAGGAATDQVTALELNCPTGRSFHKAVVHNTGRKASSEGLDMLVLGGIGSSGSVRRDDASWVVTWHLNLKHHDNRSADHESVSEHLVPLPSAATIADDTAGADAFLKKLELEDFFGAGELTSTVADGHESVEPAAASDVPPIALESTISASSMEAWPNLSPDKPPSTTGEAAGDTIAVGTAGPGPAGGGASVAGQLEAAVQLCAQLRATVATTQQSEASYRAMVASREAEIQRLEDAREVDRIRSDQLVEEMEVRARWGGLPLSIQRAMQLYNPVQSIDSQKLPLKDIETMLSSVKALKLAEVARWQALVRGGTPAVVASTHRWLPATQQPAAPDLSFLLYESGDAVPISEVSQLVAEYERLCKAEMQLRASER